MPGAWFQSCLTHVVLAPERFRGVCPFGASPVRRGLSHAGLSAATIYQRHTLFPATASRSLTAGSLPCVAAQRLWSRSLAAGSLRSILAALRRRSAGLAGLATGTQLIVGVGSRYVVVGPLARQLRELALDLVPDLAHRDAEDALPALDQVDDLVV